MRLSTFALSLLCTAFLLCMGSCRSHRQATSVAREPKDADLQQVQLTDVQQRRFNELFLEAARQKQAEHVDAQFELLNAALEINPQASEALYEMAVLRLTYSAYSDTLSRAIGDSLLHKAVRLEPDNLSYKETLGIFLANSARYREAIRIYEEMADANASAETIATLIWLYQLSGDYAGAIRSIERLERIDGKSEALSMEKFQTYLAMKDDEHAYKAIEDLCAEYPLDLRYRVLLGDMYDKNGYHERAIEIYKDVLTAEPENSYAQLSLLAYYKAAGADSLYRQTLENVVLNPRTQEEARIEAMKGYAADNISRQADSTEVLKLFRQILQQPQNTRDMAELCYSYMYTIGMQGMSLIPILQKMLDAEPDYTLGRLHMLQIMLQHDDMEQTAAVCREGEMYSPGEITFYYYEGAALFRMNRNAEAIEALQRGVQRIGNDTDAELASDLYAQLGDIYHEMGNKQQAFDAYEKALEYNKDNLLCLNNYAYFLSLDKRDLEKAEGMSKRTVDAEPQNATYLDTYAWIMFQLRQYTQAKIYINETLNNADETQGNASLYDHAGDIYFRNGHTQDAMNYWKKAWQLTTDKADKQKILRKLRRRRI